MTILQDPGTVAPAHMPQMPAARPGTVRRRRVVLGLSAALAITGVAAIGTTSAAAWSAFAMAVSACGAYGFLVHRARRLELERGFMHLRAPGATHPTEDFIGALARYAVRGEVSEELAPVAALPSAGRRALVVARFMLSYAAGWALAPLLFLLTIAVGRTPKDTTGQRWLANLEATQQKLREQSLRTLVVSAAATASVTGVGASVVAGGVGVGVAAAAPAIPSQAMPALASVAITQSAASSPAMTYTVASGDTLSQIAARFGTTFEALAQLNHLSDPNLIYPGQHLAIPEAAAAAAASRPAPSTYTVAAGDTLSGIAGRFGTTYQALARINGIADPNMIQVGEVLRLSGSPTRSTRVRTVSSRSTSPRGTTSPARSAPSRSAPARSTTPSRQTGPARPAPAPAPAAPASSRAGTAVNTALAQVGKPYQWAGAGPSAFDCSGLVMYAWESAGVRLAHYTVSQYEETTRISEGQLEPGDLVFYDTGDGAQPGHVTIYIGNGRVVTADSPGTDVRVESISWDGTPMGFGRVS